MVLGKRFAIHVVLFRTRYLPFFFFFGGKTLDCVGYTQKNVCRKYKKEKDRCFREWALALGLGPFSRTHLSLTGRSTERQEGGRKGGRGLLEPLI